jgi:signal transduction histidine kinase
VVGCVTLVAWSLADRQVRQEVEERLQNIGRVVAKPAYPMTPTVLRSVSDLTNAHFVLVDESGKWVQTTLPIDARQTQASVSSPEFALISKSMRFDHAFAGPNNEHFHAGWIRFEGSDRQSIENAKAIGILLPLSLSRQMRWQALVLPLMTGLATAIGLSSIAAWLTHRIVHRLRAVQSKVQLIAAGDYAPIPLPGTVDELHALTQNINQMANELEGLEASIQANERDKLVHSLSAGLSHDLRNTLTGARLAIQLHAKGCHRDDESIEVAIRQLRLAEEQLARWMRLGDHSGVSPALPFKSMADNAMELVRPMMDHLGSQLEMVRSEASDLVVLAESDLVESALLNLLLNAVQAAGQNGRIGFFSRVDGNDLQIEITDNGPGPDPEIQLKMFDPLVTTKLEGIGLGLAIVSKTAKLLNGSIQWSREDGLTRFMLTVPWSNTGATTTS